MIILNITYAFILFWNWTVMFVAHDYIDIKLW